MSNQLLAPCPLCGHGVYIKRVGNTGGFVCPENSPCHASGLCFLFTLDKEATAIAAWNAHRAPNIEDEVRAWVIELPNGPGLLAHNDAQGRAFANAVNDGKQFAAVTGIRAEPLYRRKS